MAAIRTSAKETGVKVDTDNTSTLDEITPPTAPAPAPCALKICEASHRPAFEAPEYGLQYIDGVPYDVWKWKREHWESTPARFLPDSRLVLAIGDVYLWIVGRAGGYSRPWE